MLWSEEHYFRVYTRDTEEYTSWGEETRLVFLELGRKADADGVVMFRSEEGLARLLRLRVETVRAGLKQLTEESAEGPPYAELIAGGVIVRNHVEAQEAKRSDVQRKRDQRKRDNRAVRVTSRKPPDEVSRDVTPRDQPSHPVTTCHSYSALQSSAKQKESPERARDPSAPEPHPEPAQGTPEPASEPFRLAASERDAKPSKPAPALSPARQVYQRWASLTPGPMPPPPTEQQLAWIDARIADHGLEACLRAAIADRHPGRRERRWVGIHRIYGSDENFRGDALRVVDAAIAEGAEWLRQEAAGPPPSTAAPCSGGCGQKAYACKCPDALTEEAEKAKQELEARFATPKKKPKPQEAA